MTSVGVLVGNLKPRSRTLAVAQAVAAAAADVAGLADAEPIVVDLADLGPRLFDLTAIDIVDTVERIAGCTLVVVASPTYKASYSGLLKAFLDRFSATGLSGVVAIPLMVGATSRHALAVEVHLRPILVEIGATLPTRGFYITEPELEGVNTFIDLWLKDAASALLAAVKRVADQPLALQHGHDQH